MLDKYVVYGRNISPSLSNTLSRLCLSLSLSYWYVPLVRTPFVLSGCLSSTPVITPTKHSYLSCLLLHPNIRAVLLFISMSQSLRKYSHCALHQPSVHNCIDIKSKYTALINSTSTVNREHQLS